MVSAKAALVGMGFGFFAIAAHAQYAYPGCAAITDKDFTATTVVSRTNSADIFEPLKMDFQMDADGNVDIFFIERKGAIKFYDGKTKAVRVLGTIASLEIGGEDGLTGLALDPDFKNKKRIFLYYATKPTFRVSRFNLDPVTLALQPATEKVVLEWPSSRGRWHTSGAMKFDAYGDLWISAGDNETMMQGPANPSSIRGSILRIHPKEDGTYSIPQGNLWETAAAYFDGKANATVAAKYRDSTKARREVFVKGVRNPYTLTVDPVRRWGIWGDCGPDQESGSSPDSAIWTEEHNIATTAGFYGWPFWTSIQHVQKVKPYSSEPTENAAWGDWSALKPDAPVNPFAGMAIPELVPAQIGTHSYAHSCAMTGPIYRYDGTLKNTAKLPPSFNRMWLVTDFNRGTIKAVKINDAAKVVAADVEIFKGVSPNFNKPLDFQQGPDGALYYLNYSCGTWYTADACTGIYRIDYKGACQDPSLKLEMPTALDRNPVARASQGPRVAIASGRIAVGVAGGFTFALHDMNGKVVRSFSSEGAHEYRAADLLAGSKPGVYFVRLESAEGLFTGSVSHFP